MAERATSTRQLYRFTVKCSKFQRGTSTLVRGGSFTLPVGHPDAAGLKKDPRLTCGLISPVQSKPAPAPVGPRFSRAAQVCYQQTIGALDSRAAAVVNLSPEDRAAYLELVTANLPRFATLLEGIGPGLLAVVFPETVVDQVEAPELEADQVDPGAPAPELGADDSQGLEAAPAAAVAPDRSGLEREAARMRAELEAPKAPAPPDAPAWGDSDPGAVARLARQELEAERLATEAAEAARQAKADPSTAPQAAAAALEAHRAELVAALASPGGRKLGDLVKLAERAGLAVPPELRALRTRAELIAGLSALLAPAAPAARAAAPSPDSLAE
jgi:hypothetical protein